MSMTKSEIADLIYREMGYPKAECYRLVESFFDIIKNELVKGNEVMVSGFGKWSVRDKKARNGRNPKTGELLIINSRKIVGFRCSEKLRNAVNGDSEIDG